MTWTTFMDMHSGGYLKEKWCLIFIEAPQDDAVKIFNDIFEHDPNDITCSCCCEDYAIYENDTLENASGYHRRCKFVMEYNGERIPISTWRNMSLDERKNVKQFYVDEGSFEQFDHFINRSDVRIIKSNEIERMRLS
jgi:hypothetical protein